MLTIIIAMALWEGLALSDYKYLSISTPFYITSVIIMAAPTMRDTNASLNEIAKPKAKSAAIIITDVI